MLTTMLIGALIGLGCAVVLTLATWILSCLARLIFDKFKDKDPETEIEICIKDTKILQEVVDGIKEKNEDMGNRLGDALLGRSPKALSMWISEDGDVKEVDTIEAEDATVDEIGDNAVLRFERYTGKIMSY